MGKVRRMFVWLCMTVLSGLVIGSMVLHFTAIQQQSRRGSEAKETGRPVQDLDFTTKKPSVRGTSEAVKRHPTASPPKSQSSGLGASIPHIIHQTWDAPTLPKFFTRHIQSWVTKHPQWQYWFWNADDIRLLISRCFPDEYLKLYNNYTQVVHRADSFRYFALYIFGGLYVDLDMIALKSHDDLIDRHPCVVTQETYEHSVLLYNNTDEASLNLINAYIACRPHHPFMRLMVEELPASAHIKYFLRKTGPLFEDFVHKKYINISLQEEKGWTGAADKVHVLNPRYVMPTYDRGQLGTLSGKCRSPNRSKAPLYTQVCKEFLSKRSRTNAPYPESLADHTWLHTYGYEGEWKKKKAQGSIDDIVPKRVNVTERIIQACPSKSDQW